VVSCNKATGHFILTQSFPVLADENHR
jgi:hypothetical protein